MENAGSWTWTNWAKSPLSNMAYLPSQLINILMILQERERARKLTRTVSDAKLQLAMPIWVIFLIIAPRIVRSFPYSFSRNQY